MNKIHHYKDYKRRTVRKYIVTYKCVDEMGNHKNGHLDYRDSGRLSAKRISDFLKKEYGYQVVVIISVSQV